MSNRDKFRKLTVSAKLSSFEEVQRELTRIVNELNNVLEKITIESEIDRTSGTDGNSGDIKITTLKKQ